MSVAQHKCGGCGTVVRRDDSPVASSDLRPKRMSFTDGAQLVYVVDLCDVCFADAQDASREQLAHIAEREARLEDPELARPLEGEHTAVIEGTNQEPPP